MKNNPEYDRWFANDMQVVTWILSTLSEEILPQVLDIVNAYDLWGALRNSYMRSEIDVTEAHIDGLTPRR